MSTLFERMLEQYESANDSYGESKYDLKNYFTTHLPKGIDESTKHIRILPPIDGQQTPFVEMWVHKQRVDGQWKTFPCPKHEVVNEDGSAGECPFCDGRELLLASGDEDDKELAKKYRARKMYVVKVIDREAEEEGVKFWRFNHNFKKQGVFDKIIKAIKNAEHDVTDPVTGRDLVIELARDETNKKVVNVVSVLPSMKQTPLSTDEKRLDKWLSDQRTWKDHIYSVRTYDYLALIVKGDIPVYDKDAGKWVAKGEEGQSSDESRELEETLINRQNVEKKAKEAVSSSQPTAVATVTDDSDEDDDDDLPF